MNKIITIINNNHRVCMWSVVIIAIILHSLNLSYVSLGCLSASALILTILTFFTNEANRRIDFLLYYSFHVGLIIAIFADLYKRFGLNFPEKFARTANDFLYFSIVTFTTLGFSDITPNEKTRMLASMEALLGYLFMGLFMGIIFNLLQNNRGVQSSRSYRQS